MSGKANYHWVYFDQDDTIEVIKETITTDRVVVKNEDFDFMQHEPSHALVQELLGVLFDRAKREAS